MDAAYRRHREQVFRYLRRRTQSDELAEDLTQDVFAAAAAHLSSLDPARPLLAWLYSVARNRLIDESRRNQARPEVVALNLVGEPSDDARYGAEVAQALRRASLRLSAPERRLLGLRLFAGKSFQDIAAELGSTEAAAKMRYLRAARSLRSELEKEGIEYDCG